ncbi:hypothetical protein BDW74DRAFT_74690 [Aspergillus multicolor]|uniref:uncharacterized protein n=1 Tax=Aspergillus multicolor TaxID=41759 RepID=UPI003CCDAC1E
MVRRRRKVLVCWLRRLIYRGIAATNTTLEAQVSRAVRSPTQRLGAFGPVDATFSPHRTTERFPGGCINILSGANTTPYIWVMAPPPHANENTWLHRLSQPAPLRSAETQLLQNVESDRNAIEYAVAFCSRSSTLPRDPLLLSPLTRSHVLLTFVPFSLTL